MVARISRRLHDELLDRAAADPACEVCGLLLGETSRDEREGRGYRIVEARPAANTADDPARRFEIDPVALFAALRAGRAGGPRVIGHYHSHPHGPPAPSPCDAALAHDPGRLWLIVGAGRVTAWRAELGGPVHGAFAPVMLDIAEDGCETGHLASQGRHRTP